MKMYFESFTQVKATPLKVVVGEYEISLAGDDNLRHLHSKESEKGKTHILSRLSIAVFRNNEVVEEFNWVEFDDFVNVVAKYKKLSEEGGKNVES